jgi:hypothetical protein
VGHVEHTTVAGTSTRGRRLGWRTCLRKGCGRRYQAGHWRQRYCRKPDCQRELRRWQAARRQRQRRATAEGREQHARAERERRRRKEESKDVRGDPGLRRCAWSRHKKISGGPTCDRPGCFESPRPSIRTPARYCGNECRRAMRRVRDRERKWKSRKTKAGRWKRRLEYQALRAKRRQRALPGNEDREDSRPAAAREGRPRAVGVYRHASKSPLTSPHPQDHETPNHDPQANPPSRPRAPPAC